MEDWWKKNLNGIKSFYLFFFIIILFAFFGYLVFAESGGLIQSNQWDENLTNVYISSSAWGDVDNDGDLDLVLTGDANGNVAKVYINNGSSLLESNQWQENLSAVFHSSLAWGDVDNDGDLDLVVTGCISGTLLSCTTVSQSKVYINNGSSLLESNQWQ